jgi:hypothetical protein
MVLRACRSEPQSRRGVSLCPVSNIPRPLHVADPAPVAGTSASNQKSSKPTPFNPAHINVSGQAGAVQSEIKDQLWAGCA